MPMQPKWINKSRNGLNLVPAQHDPDAGSQEKKYQWKLNQLLHDEKREW